MLRPIRILDCDLFDPERNSDVLLIAIINDAYSNLLAQCIENAAQKMLSTMLTFVKSVAVICVKFYHDRGWLLKRSNLLQSTHFLCS